ATGDTPVSTQFTLPDGLAAGDYSLVVIANGIASDPVTFTVGGNVPGTAAHPHSRLPLVVMPISDSAEWFASPNPRQEVGSTESEAAVLVNILETGGTRIAEQGEQVGPGRLVRSAETGRDAFFATEFFSSMTDSLAVSL